MDKDDDRKPSSSDANKKTSNVTKRKPAKNDGGQKAPPKKPASSKNQKSKAPAAGSESTDWDDLDVVTKQEFVPFYAPDSVLTNELDEKWIKTIEEAAEKIAKLKMDAIKDEFDNLFSDDEEESEDSEGEFNEEDIDDDSIANLPVTTPKIVSSAPPVETEPIEMPYFEPISENVKGRNEYQLSNVPLLDEDTEDRAICAGVFKLFDGGVHGYLEEKFESSQQIIFKIMTDILEKKDANFNPDFFYYAMYRVFPNTGCQKEMAEMYPKLARMFAKDQDELRRLLELEPWKVGKVEKEDKPLDYKHPLSEGNYLFKSFQFAHDDQRCSPNCYKGINAGDKEKLLKCFELVADSVKLYLPKNCKRADAPFLNALVLNDEEEMITDFCAVSKQFDTRTCAGWAEYIIKLARPTPIQEKPKSQKDKYKTFLKTFAKSVADEQIEFKKRKAENGDSDQGDSNEGDFPQTCTRFKPCCHFGPCGPDVPNCSCGSVCSVFCQCDDNCMQKYPGCMCSANKCGTTSCQCRKLKWECIEGACHSCLKPTTENPQPWCQNHLMTMKKGKLVEIGKSLIAGTGAFLKEDANANDYLGEYTGEYISEEETERRGKVYELSTSYIFGLGWKQGSIDSGRAGNVFRFVNHSNKPNCFTAMRIVNGKPVIGFYAKQKMRAGTELTFDYDYNQEDVIKYFQNKPEDRVPKMKSTMESPVTSPHPPSRKKPKRYDSDSDDDYDSNKPSTSSKSLGDATPGDWDIY
ncbi:hypothetical protein CAEBREN_02812 [Caenorhabditis brenneri]|uniref:Uncharacterized protein n=1 Tax=Caenorhabditis brenneri TaxID=135651 RepID=G0NQU2_CAEBE|nr:hypothetical protein CAEBREN_02812 [Caenorhabditis brenneri]